jgi:hypothetical protein
MTDRGKPRGTWPRWTENQEGWAEVKYGEKTGLDANLASPC